MPKQKHTIVPITLHSGLKVRDGATGNEEIIETDRIFIAMSIMDFCVNRNERGIPVKTIIKF